MKYAFTVALLLFSFAAVTQLKAQSPHMDSLRTLLHADSIQFANEMKYAENVKPEADSLLKMEMLRIKAKTLNMDTTHLSSVKDFIQNEQAKKQAEEKSDYWKMVAALGALIVMVLVFFKKRPA